MLHFIGFIMHVSPIAGSGGWIHGCAEIFWNQHDTTSTVCYSQVNIVGYSFPLLCVCAYPW